MIFRCKSLFLISKSFFSKELFLHFFTLFLAIFFFICLGNFFLGVAIDQIYGRFPHTLMTAGLGSSFLLLIRKDQKDIFASILAYFLLLIPIVFLATLSPLQNLFLKKDFSVLISEANCWALSTSVLVMLVTIFSAFCKNSWIRRLVQAIAAILWVLLLSFSLAFIAYWLTHHAVLSSDVLVAIYQTDPSEAFEYLSDQSTSLSIALVTAFTLLLLTAFRVSTLKQTFSLRHPNISLITFFIIIISFGVSIKTQDNLTLSIFTKTKQTIEALKTFQSSLSERQALMSKISNLEKQGESGLFVVVIGESLSRDRISAYGFERDTTPWLKNQRQKDQLIFLENAYSNYPSTLLSLSQALTAKTQYNDRPLNECPSLVEIFKAAGFHTSWISMQGRFSAFESPTTAIASLSDTQRWLLEEGELYDQALVQSVQNLPITQGKHVLFLHMMGAHSKYPLRYPPSFEHWPLNNEKSARANSYDNAIRYNDTIWRDLIEVLKTRSDFQALVMFSDHGEDMKEQHTPEPERFTWAMVRIPTWFYFSDSYAKKHPDRLRTLKQNAIKPWTNDLLFDVVLGLTSVTNHPFYSESNDIMSPAFNRPYETLYTIHGRLPLTKDPEGLRVKRRIQNSREGLPD